MRNPFHTPFVTVFQNEVLLNSKRVAPYALTILFRRQCRALVVQGTGRPVGLGDKQRLLHRQEPPGLFFPVRTPDLQRSHYRRQIWVAGLGGQNPTNSSWWIVQVLPISAASIML